MPSTPTTKSQVQAYRFVLRRMQSALVRKDAVMLHDPMRTHSRATIVGVALAGLGLLGFLIWGILAPKAAAPTKDGIVIGKQSGQVYVMLTQPQKRLIPVFNLASARLLLYAQQQQGNDRDQQGSSQTSTPASTEVVQPEVIDDNQLRDIPTERKVGIVDGPDLLPSSDQRLEHNNWTVCDQYVLDQDLPNPASRNKVETTVIAGVDKLGPELTSDQSLLVRGPNGDTYLVYRTPTDANLPNTNTVRAKVDMHNPSITAALGLNDSQIRNITTGLLNAIPEKAELKSPDIPGRGQGAPYDIGQSLQIGEVFKVQTTGGTQYYVVLRDGIQEIRQTTADLIRFERDLGGAQINTLSPEVVSQARDQGKIVNQIDDSTFPDVVATPLRPDTFPVACLSWTTKGDGSSEVEQTSVHIGQDLPGVPKDSQKKPELVDISTPSADGIRIDHFYMPPGRAAVVRQATSDKDFATGQITLVSDRGVKYGVPDVATANVLGLSDQKPAPREIIQLLPDGASLSADDVQQSYDSVPHGPGVYPSPSTQPGGG